MPDDFAKELEDLLGNEEPTSVVADPVPEPEPEPSPEPVVKPDLEPSPEPAPEPEPAPVSESEPTPEPVSEPTPEPEDELTLLRNQNAALLARIDEVEGRKLVVPAEPEPTPEPVKEISFLGEDVDVDELIGDRAKLNALLVGVYKKALEDSQVGARESTLRAIPQMIVNQVQKQMVLREGITEFFKENKDLTVARRTMGALMNEVVGEHPEWGLKEVMEEAGTRTRKVLGLKRQVTVVDKKGGDRNPAFVDKGNSGRVKTSDQRSGIQKEIDDLIDL